MRLFFHKFKKIISRKSNTVTPVYSDDICSIYPICPICSKEYHVEKKIRLQDCNHELCFECMYTMFLNRNDKVWCRFCPVCRKSFTVKDYSYMKKMYWLYPNKYSDTNTLSNEHIDIMISQSNYLNNTVVTTMLDLIIKENSRCNIFQKFDTCELNRIMGR
jgi:hypothetical protein